ncbi:MAG: zinc metalloprotease HtpX [Candidatus Acetothermia bacterium]
MQSFKLRLGMLGSVGLIIGITTLGAALLLNGVLHLSFVWTLIFLIPLFFLQWYFAPRMVEYSMQVEPASPERYPELHRTVEEISRDSQMEKPEVMISRVEMPNAFAYGNIFSGHKVAVTDGLLGTLEQEEVEAVLAHEIGHLKHRDSEVMMFISILPALFMMLGRMLLWSSIFGGRRRNGAPIILVAFGAMLFYFLLNLCILWFSRLREYYADEFSANAIVDGPRKLQEGLAKINHAMAQLKERKAQGQGFQSGRQRPEQAGIGISPLGAGMKPLFISDPDVSQPLEGYSDRELVEKYKNQQTGLGAKFFELFTTHPEISKRLKALDNMRSGLT